MTRDELLDVFKRSGALLEGHFRLTSGLHSSGYLQCALVLQHPQHAEALGRALRERTRGLRPTLVLSPALGGIVIGQEVGRALGVRAIFAERQDGALTLRRGFIIGEGDRVLVVEDVLTTGGSTRETMQVAAASGGQVVGAAVLLPAGEQPALAGGRDRAVADRECGHGQLRPAVEAGAPRLGSVTASVPSTATTQTTVVPVIQPVVVSAPPAPSACTTAIGQQA